MANNNNLKPPFNELTPEEHREIAKKGGKASVESRKKKKKEKDLLKMLLELPIKDKEIINRLKKLGIDESLLTNEMLAIYSLFKQVTKGDMQAIKYMDEKIGNSPLLKLKEREIELKEKLAEKESPNDNAINENLLTIASLINNPQPNRSLPIENEKLNE